MCATWVPQIIGAVPEIQHGESRVTTEGVHSPNVAMSILHFVYMIFVSRVYTIWHNMHAIDTMYIVFIYELQALSDELYLVTIY